MTSGVGRPQSLQDILGALAGQSSGASSVSTTISGVGYISEADESTVSTDAVTTLVQSMPPWDQAQWGAVSWG